MIRQCCRCGEIYGEKEPLEDKSVTHGYCDKCFEEEMKEIRAYQKERRKENVNHNL